MEQQGFEFSGFLKILLLVVFAVIYLFRAGAKSAPTEPNEDSDTNDDEAYDPFKRLMEMFEGPTQATSDEHEDKQVQEQEPANTFEREPQRQAQNLKPNSRPNLRSMSEVPTVSASKNRVVQSTYNMATADENELEIQRSEASELAENFDLRQAVIMSEILAPKFNEN